MRGAKGDRVIRRGTCEGAGLVVCVTRSVWARTLEYLRVHKRLTRVGCTIRATTTILRLIKGLARALTRYVLDTIGARDLQLGRARHIKVGHAASACTILTSPTLRHDKHRDVVPINQAYIKEIHATITIKRELS